MTETELNISQIKQDVNNLKRDIDSVNKQHTDCKEMRTKEIDELYDKFDKIVEGQLSIRGDLKKEIDLNDKQNQLDHSEFVNTIKEIQGNTNIIWRELKEIIQLRNKINSVIWKVITSIAILVATAAVVKLMQPTKQADDKITTEIIVLKDSLKLVTEKLEKVNDLRKYNEDVRSNP